MPTAAATSFTVSDEVSSKRRACWRRRSFRYAVRFVGADQPGAYQANLHVVTQAGNLGFLSQCGDSAPPTNLYYLDLPLTVRVGTEVVTQTKTQE